MADDKRASEHLKESYEGNQDLSQGVGEDKLPMEVQSLSVDPEAGHFGCSSLHSTPRDDVEVERVASTHRSQLDDLTTPTWRNKTCK